MNPMVSCPRLTVAALRGSAGKTTLTLGLIGAYRRRGRSVGPAKKGPDYIDAAWLSRAAGRPCRNLDTFMLDRARVRQSFGLSATGAELVVIEGNRGLYDGMDADGTHSTAELAKLVDSPVLLVCDCSKVSRTMAAMVAGCRHLDPDVAIGGVILNHVRGARHEAMLTACIEQDAGLPVLGAVPRLDELAMPERHLGLAPPREHLDPEGVLAEATRLAERYLDLDAIWQLARQAGPVEIPAATVRAESASGVRIGVVRDRAFWFYYPENTEALQSSGAELITVDALGDSELPDVDALYIGGGFPETQARALADNVSFRTSLREAAAGGLPIYAECGGLIYLGRELICQDRRYPMAGVLSGTFALHRRPQAHGYTIGVVDRDNPFLPVGTELRGHEFHYTRVVEGKPSEDELAISVRRGRGIAAGRDGWIRDNVMATYGHLHALGTPGWADALVARAAAFRSQTAEARGGQ